MLPSTIAWDRNEGGVGAFEVSTALRVVDIGSSEVETREVKDMDRFGWVGMRFGVRARKFLFSHKPTCTAEDVSRSQGRI